ncbi:MAG: PPC domain-containing protein [Clostridia bacterium]|nr:PPC domain-containing protein [Clostridia bacterium]
MKRFIAIFMVALTVLLMLSACAGEFVEDTEKENNNTAETANKVRLNAHVSGYINPSDDVDWYSFTLPNAADVTLDMSFRSKNPSDMYWTISVYEADGVTVLYHYNRQGNEAASFDFGTLPQNTYFIKISASVGASNISYGLRVVKKHDCEGSFAVTKAPTCTEDGIEEKLCMVCGSCIESRVIPATGHKSDSWTVDEEATCSREGTRHGHCAVCNEDVFEKIEKLEHDLGAWIAVNPATCNGEGTEQRSCSHCSYKEEQTVAQLNHRFGDWENISGNIIIPPIVREHDCELCGITETVKDWGYVWVTVIAAVLIVGIIIGVIVYIKAYI